MSKSNILVTILNCCKIYVNIRNNNDSSNKNHEVIAYLRIANYHPS